MKCWPLLLLSVCCLLHSPIVTAALQPTHIDISPFDQAFQPTAINDQGQVVGFGREFSPNSGRAFFWTKETGLTTIGSLEGWESSATHITSRGRVFGYDVFVPAPNFGRDYAYRAFTWTPVEGMRAIDPIYGIENIIEDVEPRSGAMVGYSCQDEDSNDCRAFFWTETQGAVSITPPDAATPRSCYPTDLNALGQVAGYCVGRGLAQPFFWSQRLGFSFIPQLPSNQCYAEALNDSAQVVGHCSINVGGRNEVRGFVWRSNQPLVALSIEGSLKTYPRAINNAGQIAGNSDVGAWSTNAQRQIVKIEFGQRVSSDYLALTESGHVIGFATSSSPSWQYAFVWKGGTGLLLRHADGQNSFPRSWSPLGHVVGQAFDSNSQTRGFFWSPTKGMLELVPLDNPNGSAGLVADAYAVNSWGQVAGIQDNGDFSGALWNTGPAPTTPFLLGSTDTSAPGLPGPVLVLNDPNQAEIRNSLGAGLQAIVPFVDPMMGPLAGAILADTDGDGQREIALLRTRKNDERLLAEIRNVDDPTTRRRVAYPPGLNFLAFAPTPSDLSGNGAIELAVLATDAAGRPFVYIRDIASGLSIRTIAFTAGVKPFMFTFVADRDASGVPEIAVVGKDDRGRILAQIKDALSRVLVGQVFFDNRYNPVDGIGMDLDGNGLVDALAVMGQNADGLVQLEIRNTSTGAELARTPLVGLHKPLKLVAVPDINSNNVPEIAVLYKDAGGTVFAAVRDPLAGTLLRKLKFGSAYAPKDLTVVPDANGNGAPELVFLGVNVAGRYQIQIRDSLTRSLIGTAYGPIHR